MKILINTPNWKKPYLGGVASHYYGLKPFWTENVRYNIIGSRNREGRGKYWLPWDLVKTFFLILFFQPDKVVVNTSLGANALKRDSIFTNLAHLLGKKVVVHIHGFNVNFAQKIDPNNFKQLFCHASSFIVLSSAIQRQLTEWGVAQPILLSTTKVDDRMLEGFDINQRNGDINTVLYLARVEKEKGIYIALDVFAELKQRHPELCFTVVGGGSELEPAKAYATEKGLTNVNFTGPLTGQELVNQYQSADLYLFTSYHEGMPTSVLEAMCFGLPVVTRPVGGLVDFFENDKMGQMVDSFEAKDFIGPIETLMAEPNQTHEISRYNHDYGTEHFLASKVAVNLQNLILK